MEIVIKYPPKPLYAMHYALPKLKNIKIYWIFSNVNKIAILYKNDYN